MEKYETIKITSTEHLKKSTIYFKLKEIGLSENYIKNLRNTKDAILLNDTPSTINHKISVNDEIKILKSPNTKSDIPECDGKLEILYEDEDYLIVNKPHNLACIPTRKHITNNLGGQVMKYMLKQDENFVLRIVNRLDRETAGIVVIAKNITAFNKMKAEKTYFALCLGNLDKKSFTIKKRILTKTENGINQMKREISENGKEATTHVKLIKNYEGYFLASFTLETGRTHQIRVHMKSENHPLLGDLIYSEIKDDTRSHTFLILKEISFTHFKTKEHISISVNFPAEWNSYLK